MWKYEIDIMGLQEHLINDNRLTPFIEGYKMITRIGSLKHLGIIIYIKNWSEYINEIETNVDQNVLFGGHMRNYC